MEKMCFQSWYFRLKSGSPVFWARFSLSRKFVAKSKYRIQSKFLIINSTGASDRSFYPIFNKRFDHLEKLLKNADQKKFCQLGHCAGLWFPVPSLDAPKGPSCYPKSIMFQFEICYQSHWNVSWKTKTNINFRGQTWVRPPAKCWVKGFYFTP